MSELPGFVQTVAGPLFATIGGLTSAPGSGKRTRAEAERVFVTVSRLGLPLQRASIRLQVSARDAVDREEFEKAILKLPTTVKFKEAAYSSCARVYADELANRPWQKAPRPARHRERQTTERHLGLTTEQAGKVAQAVSDYRNAVSDLFASETSATVDRDARMAQLRTDSENLVAAVVGPAAAKRLTRLSWRIRNADALFDSDVGTAIGLTVAQREELARVRRDNRLEASLAMREISGARFKNQTAFEQRAAESHVSGDERLLAAWTPGQRRAFERLKRGDPL